MSAHFTTPTDELLLLAETLGEVKTKADKLEAEFATQARPLEAATNALSAALSGIKALQFHVLDNNLGALSARVEEMRKAVDEQVGVIALELKKADETNAAKAGREAEALRSEIAALQAQLGTLGAQFSAQLERVEFSAKEEAKKLQLIPGPAGAAGASLNPRGTFIDNETYNRLDVVSWLGSSYIAAVDGVTEKPSKNSNQWQVLASRGGGAAGGAADFGSLAGVAQINQGGTGQTTRAAGLNALLPSQTGNVQYMLLTDGAGTVSWGAQPVAGLPSQTSNGGKLLTTDGTNASWSNAVTVSGSNATVTGTLTVSGVLSSTSSTSDYGWNITSSGVGGPFVTLDATNATTANRFTGLLLKNNGTLQWVAQLRAGDGNFHIYDAVRSVSTLTIAPGALNGVAGTSTFAGAVAITSTSSSTTTSTGALVVGNGTSGGLGVGGAIVAGGTITSTASTDSGLLQLNLVNSSTGTSASSLFRFNAGTRTATLQAYNDTHATLAGQLRVGTSNGDIVVIPSGVAATTFGSSTVTVNHSTASTSTSSGALVVSGGVGVGGALNVGGQIRAQLGLFAGSPPAGLASAYQVDVDAGTSRDILSWGDSSRVGLIRGEQDGSGRATLKFGRYTASTFAEYFRVTGLAATDAIVNIYGTTASTSTSSGALVVSGGVGVAGAIYVGGAGDFAGQLNLNSGTASAPSLKLNSTNNGIYYTGSNIVRIAANGAEAATFGGAAATVVGSFQTGAPSGGTAAAWKLGTVASVSPTSPNRTIEVDIGGTIYYIHAKTTNN